MLVGWLRWPAALGLGGVLVLVTFGHLLAEPLFAFDAHVVPRTVLLVIVLALFGEDRLEPGRVADPAPRRYRLTGGAQAGVPRRYSSPPGGLQIPPLSS